MQEILINHKYKNVGRVTKAIPPPKPKPNPIIRTNQIKISNFRKWIPKWENKTKKRKSKVKKG